MYLFIHTILLKYTIFMFDRLIIEIDLPFFVFQHGERPMVKV